MKAKPSLTASKQNTEPWRRTVRVAEAISRQPPSRSRSLRGHRLHRTLRPYTRCLHYARAVRTCCRLAAFPEAARLRPDLGEGVRLSVSGNYVILYVMHPDLMENPDGNP